MTNKPVLLPPRRPKKINESGFLYCIRDKSLREIFERLLKECKVDRINMALTSNEVELFFRNGLSCDVFVCDISNQSNDHLEMIKFIRWDERSSDRAMPIIVLGKAWTASSILQCRNIGVTGVIQSEMTVHSLFTRLMRAIYSERCFVMSASYCGPDRRVGKFSGLAGPYRRTTDRMALRKTDPVVPHPDANSTAPNEAPRPGAISQSELSKILKKTD